MPDCCPRRAAFAAPPPSGAVHPASHPASRSRSADVRVAIAATCLQLVGWYRLERLLASIPDSNDDFGIG
ncbi:hypothetical protein [Burkholderia sp. IMCC1007]|uniref:hypothetical protein n=1 Tax=Burkholderia sp. IMCC1007 TaxID=3004104 RepID=UPI0022B33D6B|nr:hypothetical protein [Burkholderia sp. IMCC1007]